MAKCAWLHAAPVAALLFGISACSGTHGECPEGEPSFTAFLVEPATVAPGGTVTLTLEGKNLGFSAPGSEEHAHDEGEGHEHGECPGGHLHVYLDDLETNPIVMAEGLEAEATIPDDTPAGEHTLIARLHNRDHTIYEPEVTIEAALTVE